MSGSGHTEPIDLLPQIIDIVTSTANRVADAIAESIANSIMDDISDDDDVPPSIPRSVSIRSGHQKVLEIMFGHEQRAYDLFRMRPQTINTLVDKLEDRGLLKSSRGVSSVEAVCYFLQMVGHGHTNRALAEDYIHSGETISRKFNEVLDAVCALCNDYIVMQTTNTNTHRRISENPRFYPYFKNAIGAIDGTHIPVLVRRDKQNRYRDRKGNVSLNVMAVVDFSMEFTYVLTGWEGSAADQRVLQAATTTGGFKVPPGKYYLVDAGYANTRQFLAPYRNTAYHISEYRGNRHSYNNKKEMFNHRHAQLRNVVERAFGVLKRRFAYLKKGATYPIHSQCRLVMACCILHNFIRRQNDGDAIMEEIPDNSTTSAVPPNGVDLSSLHRTNATDAREGDVQRETISTFIWDTR